MKLLLNVVCEVNRNSESEGEVGGESCIEGGFEVHDEVVVKDIKQVWQLGLK